MANALKIEITVDDKGTPVFKKFGGNAEKALGKVETHAKAGAAQAGRMEKAWGSAAKNIQHHWKAYSAVAAVSMAATAAVIVATSKKAIAAASDLQEVQGKFDVVFAGQEKKAEAWSKTLVDSYAMSMRESKQYLSSIQDLLVPMGMAADKAGLMSNEVVKLSADLGSFNNLPTSKVMEDIQSALVGNYETMKKYGVVLNATVVQEKALAMGLADTKDELTAGMKAQASYQLMVEGSTAAIGDMARTSDSYANQIKKLTANIEDLYTIIGNEFLPIATDVVNQINDWIKTNDDLIRQKVPEYFDKIKNSMQKIWDVITYDPAIIEYGLVGLAIGGKKGAVIVGSLGHMVTWIKNLSGALGLASAGLLDFSQIANANFKELEELISNAGKSGGLQQLNLKVGELREEITHLKKSTQGRIFTFAGDKERLVDLQVELKNVQAAIETLNRAKAFELNIVDVPNQAAQLELALKNVEGFFGKTGKAADKATKDEINFALKMEKEKKRMAKETAAYQKKLIKDQIKTAADFTKESIRIYERLSDDVQKLNLGDLEYSKKVLNLEYKNKRIHLEALAKQDSKYFDGLALLDRWHQEEKNKLDNDWARKHGTVLDRMGVRWRDYQKEGIDANRVMYDALVAGAAEMEKQLSDVFFNVLTGQMGKVKLDWDAMWKSMVRSTTDHMAKIVTETALNTATKAAGAGVDWLGTALGWWAAGSWEIKKQHMAMLHPGEMVLPADMAEKVRSSSAGKSNIGLGEPMAPEASLTVRGSLRDTYVDQAIKDSFKSSLIGFGVRQGAGLGAGIPVGVNPLGVIAIFAKAMYEGIRGTLKAKADYRSVYGKNAQIDWDKAMIDMVADNYAYNYATGFSRSTGWANVADQQLSRDISKAIGMNVAVNAPGTGYSRLAGGNQPSGSVGSSSSSPGGTGTSGSAGTGGGGAHGGGGDG